MFLFTQWPQILCLFDSLYDINTIHCIMHMIWYRRQEEATKCKTYKRDGNEVPVKDSPAQYKYNLNCIPCMTMYLPSGQTNMPPSP